MANKKRGRMGFFKKNFQESLSYISFSRKYIYFIISVMIFFAIIALLFPAPAELEQILKSMIKELVNKSQNLNTFELIRFIFINNFKVSIIGIFSGIFFCIVPFSIAASNGYLLGYVIKILVNKIGITEGIVSLWRLLPHGIFEIPAVVISLAIGIKLGISLFGAFNRQSLNYLWVEIKNSIKVVFFIILPLLIIAAIIEGILIAFTR